MAVPQYGQQADTVISDCGLVQFVPAAEEPTRWRWLNILLSLFLPVYGLVAGPYYILAPGRKTTSGGVWCLVLGVVSAVAWTVLIVLVGLAIGMATGRIT